MIQMIHNEDLVTYDVATNPEKTNFIFKLITTYIIIHKRIPFLQTIFK